MTLTRTSGTKVTKTIKSSTCVEKKCLVKATIPKNSFTTYLDDDDKQEYNVTIKSTDGQKTVDIINYAIIKLVGKIKNLGTYQTLFSNYEETSAYVYKEMKVGAGIQDYTLEVVHKNLSYSYVEYKIDSSFNTLTLTKGEAVYFILTDSDGEIIYVSDDKTVFDFSSAYVVEQEQIFMANSMESLTVEIIDLPQDVELLNFKLRSTQTSLSLEEEIYDPSDASYATFVSNFNSSVIKNSEVFKVYVTYLGNEFSIGGEIKLEVITDPCKLYQCDQLGLPSCHYYKFPLTINVIRRISSLDLRIFLYQTNGNVKTEFEFEENEYEKFYLNLENEEVETGQSQVCFYKSSNMNSPLECRIINLTSMKLSSSLKKVETINNIILEEAFCYDSSFDLNIRASTNPNERTKNLTCTHSDTTINCPLSTTYSGVYQLYSGETYLGSEFDITLHDPSTCVLQYTYPDEVQLNENKIYITGSEDCLKKIKVIYIQETKEEIKQEFTINGASSTGNRFELDDQEHPQKLTVFLNINGNINIPYAIRKIQFNDESISIIPDQELHPIGYYFTITKKSYFVHTSNFILEFAGESSNQQYKNSIYFKFKDKTTVNKATCSVSGKYVLNCNIAGYETSVNKATYVQFGINSTLMSSQIAYIVYVDKTNNIVCSVQKESKSKTIKFTSLIDVDPVIYIEGETDSFNPKKTLSSSGVYTYTFTIDLSKLSPGTKVFKAHIWKTRTEDDKEAVPFVEQKIIDAYSFTGIEQKEIYTSINQSITLYFDSPVNSLEVPKIILISTTNSTRTIEFPAQVTDSSTETYDHITYIQSLYDKTAFPLGKYSIYYYTGCEDYSDTGLFVNLEYNKVSKYEPNIIQNIDGGAIIQFTYAYEIVTATKPKKVKLSLKNDVYNKNKFYLTISSIEYSSGKVSYTVSTPFSYSNGEYSVVTIYNNGHEYAESIPLYVLKNEIKFTKNEEDVIHGTAIETKEIQLVNEIEEFQIKKVTATYYKEVNNLGQYVEADITDFVTLSDDQKKLELNLKGYLEYKNESVSTTFEKYQNWVITVTDFLTGNNSIYTYKVLPSENINRNINIKISNPIKEGDNNIYFTSLSNYKLSNVANIQFTKKNLNDLTETTVTYCSLTLTSSVTCDNYFNLTQINGTEGIVVTVTYDNVKNCKYKHMYILKKITDKSGLNQTYDKSDGYILADFEFEKNYQVIQNETQGVSTFTTWIDLFNENVTSQISSQINCKFTDKYKTCSAACTKITGTTKINCTFTSSQSIIVPEDMKIFFTFNELLNYFNDTNPKYIYFVKTEVDNQCQLTTANLGSQVRVYSEHIVPGLYLSLNGKTITSEPTVTKKNSKYISTFTFGKQYISSSTLQEFIFKLGKKDVYSLQDIPHKITVYPYTLKTVKANLTAQYDYTQVATFDFGTNIPTDAVHDLKLVKDSKVYLPINCKINDTKLNQLICEFDLTDQIEYGNFKIQYKIYDCSEIFYGSVDFYISAPPNFITETYPKYKQYNETKDIIFKWHYYLYSKDIPEKIRFMGDDYIYVDTDNIVFDSSQKTKEFRVVSSRGLLPVGKYYYKFIYNSSDSSYDKIYTEFTFLVYDYLPELKYDTITRLQTDTLSSVQIEFKNKVEDFYFESIEYKVDDGTEQKTLKEIYDYYYVNKIIIQLIEDKQFEFVVDRTITIIDLTGRVLYFKIKIKMNVPLDEAIITFKHPVPAKEEEENTVTLTSENYVLSQLENIRWKNIKDGTYLYISKNDYIYDEDSNTLKFNVYLEKLGQYKLISLTDTHQLTRSYENDEMYIRGFDLLKNYEFIPIAAVTIPIELYDQTARNNVLNSIYIDGKRVSCEVKGYSSLDCYYNNLEMNSIKDLRVQFDVNQKNYKIFQLVKTEFTDICQVTETNGKMKNIIFDVTAYSPVSKFTFDFNGYDEYKQEPEPLHINGVHNYVYRFSFDINNYYNEIILLDNYFVNVGRMGYENQFNFRPVKASNMKIIEVNSHDIPKITNASTEINVRLSSAITDDDAQKLEIQLIHKYYNESIITYSQGSCYVTYDLHEDGQDIMCSTQLSENDRLGEYYVVLINECLTSNKDNSLVIAIKDSQNLLTSIYPKSFQVNTLEEANLRLHYYYHLADFKVPNKIILVNESLPDSVNSYYNPITINTNSIKSTKQEMYTTILPNHPGYYRIKSIFANKKEDLSFLKILIYEHPLKLVKTGEKRKIGTTFSKVEIELENPIMLIQIKYIEYYKNSDPSSKYKAEYKKCQCICECEETKQITNITICFENELPVDDNYTFIIYTNEDDTKKYEYKVEYEGVIDFDLVYRYYLYQGNNFATMNLYIDVKQESFTTTLQDFFYVIQSCDSGLVQLSCTPNGGSILKCLYRPTSNTCGLSDSLQVMFGSNLNANINKRDFYIINYTYNRVDATVMTASNLFLEFTTDQRLNFYFGENLNITTVPVCDTRKHYKIYYYSILSITEEGLYYIYAELENGKYKGRLLDENGKYLSYSYVKSKTLKSISKIIVPYLSSQTFDIYFKEKLVEDEVKYVTLGGIKTTECKRISDKILNGLTCSITIGSVSFDTLGLYYTNVNNKNISLNKNVATSKEFVIAEISNQIIETTSSINTIKIIFNTKLSTSSGYKKIYLTPTSDNAFKSSTNDVKTYQDRTNDALNCQFDVKPEDQLEGKYSIKVEYYDNKNNRQKTVTSSSTQYLYFYSIDKIYFEFNQLYFILKSGAEATLNLYPSQMNLIVVNHIYIKGTNQELTRNDLGEFELKLKNDLASSQNFKKYEFEYSTSLTGDNRFNISEIVYVASSMNKLFNLKAPSKCNLDNEEITLQFVVNSSLVKFYPERITPCLKRSTGNQQYYFTLTDKTNYIYKFSPKDQYDFKKYDNSIPFDIYIVENRDLTKRIYLDSLYYFTDFLYAKEYVFEDDTKLTFNHVTCLMKDIPLKIGSISRTCNSNSVYDSTKGTFVCNLPKSFNGALSSYGKTTMFIGKSANKEETIYFYKDLVSATYDQIDKVDTILRIKANTYVKLISEVVIRNGNNETVTLYKNKGEFDYDEEYNQIVIYYHETSTTESVIQLVSEDGSTVNVNLEIPILNSIKYFSLLNQDGYLIKSGTNGKVEIDAKLNKNVNANSNNIYIDNKLANIVCQTSDCEEDIKIIYYANSSRLINVVYKKGKDVVQNEYIHIGAYEIFTENFCVDYNLDNLDKGFKIKLDHANFANKYVVKINGQQTTNIEYDTEHLRQSTNYTFMGNDLNTYNSNHLTLTVTYLDYVVLEDNSIIVKKSLNIKEVDASLFEKQADGNTISITSDYNIDIIPKKIYLQKGDVKTPNIQFTYESTSNKKKIIGKLDLTNVKHGPYYLYYETECGNILKHPDIIDIHPKCYKGYVYDEDSEKCKRVSNCLLSTCVNGDCIEENDMVKCNCHSGYYGYDCSIEKEEVTNYIDQAYEYIDHINEVIVNNGGSPSDPEVIAERNTVGEILSVLEDLEGQDLITATKLNNITKADLNVLEHVINNYLPNTITIEETNFYNDLIKAASKLLFNEIEYDEKFRRLEDDDKNELFKKYVDVIPKYLQQFASNIFKDIKDDYIITELSPSQAYYYITKADNSIISEIEGKINVTKSGNISINMEKDANKKVKYVVNTIINKNILKKYGVDSDNSMEEISLLDENYDLIRDSKITYTQEVEVDKSYEDLNKANVQSFDINDKFYTGCYQNSKLSKDYSLQYKIDNFYKNVFWYEGCEFYNQINKNSSMISLSFSCDPTKAKLEKMINATEDSIKTKRLNKQVFDCVGKVKVTGKNISIYITLIFFVSVLFFIILFFKNNILKAIKSNPPVGSKNDKKGSSAKNSIKQNNENKEKNKKESKTNISIISESVNLSEKNGENQIKDKENEQTEKKKEVKPSEVIVEVKDDNKSLKKFFTAFLVISIDEYKTILKNIYNITENSDKREYPLLRRFLISSNIIILFGWNMVLYNNKRLNYRLSNLSQHKRFFYPLINEEGGYIIGAISLLLLFKLITNFILIGIKKVVKFIGNDFTKITIWITSGLIYIITDLVFIFYSITFSELFINTQVEMLYSLLWSILFGILIDVAILATLNFLDFKEIKVYKPIKDLTTSN